MRHPKQQILMYPARSRANDNPYIATLAGALTNAGVALRHYDPKLPASAAQVVHVHWPERVFHNRLGSRFSSVSGYYAENLLRTLRKTRAAGGRVVWTAHNLAPHDAFKAAQKDVWNNLRNEFFGLVTDVALLSPNAAQLVLDGVPELKNARFHTVLHQHFRHVFDGLPRSNFRLAAGIEETDTLFVTFGYIKPYKRVAEIIDAFREANMKRAHLVVAGRVQTSYADRLHRAVANDQRIRIIDRGLDNVELANIIRAADVSVFNFAEQFNSGSLITSLSLNTPVMSPKFAAGSEIASRVGPAWMYETKNNLSPKDLQFARDHFSRVDQFEQPDMNHLAPGVVAARHKTAFGLEN